MIPSGKLSKKEALLFAILCSGTGVALSFLVNIQAITISASVVLILVLYAVRLKGTPLIGNVTVAILTSLTFVSGGVAVERPIGALIPAAFAFLFTFARELVKDIEDIEGDRRVGARTAPVAWGIGISKTVSAAIMMVVVVVSPIPFIANYYTWRYLVAVILGVDVVMIWCALWILWRPNAAPKVQKIMKADIIAGLLAIYIS
jgi:geranylgeranylglycerol-phosphate geranylgeranyltransferase